MTEKRLREFVKLVEGVQHPNRSALPQKGCLACAVLELIAEVRRLEGKLALTKEQPA